MDPGAEIVEAEVDLDGVGLAREQQRRQGESGKLATTAAKGGFSASNNGNVDDRDDNSEDSPLLDRRKSTDDSEEDTSWPGDADFAHLPWHKRPSVYWVIAPFFIMACAFGGIITPKLNLTLDLICRNYFADMVQAHPGFTMVPVDFNGNNGQCRIPEVQSRVSIFQLWAGLISGILAAFTSPKLGALSDRYGRKPILVATSCGTLAGEIVTIFAATFPDTFPVPLLLVSYALDGLLGSFIVAMSISNAYATDCTPPNRRNVVFGYFHASLFAGIAIGPITAGYITKWTGKISTVFYIMGAAHLAFIIFVTFVVPESLSKKRQLAAREKHDKLAESRGSNWDLINHLRALHILEPLKILHPTGPGTSPALRWNLMVLAAVDTIVFGVAMGSMTVIIIYMNIQFGWETFESGRFMTIVSTARVLCLLVVLPAVTRLVRGKPSLNRSTKNTGSDWFDLTVIRCAILFDTLGFLGYSLSRQGGPFILSGVVASMGGIGSPALQASLTKHVPADRTGQLLGAMGLLHALARVVSPTIFNAIYSATVGTFRQTVFVCLCSTFFLAFIVSWFIRPGVYYDEDHADRADTSEQEDEGQPQGTSRLPIVGAVTAATAFIAAAVGFETSQPT